MYKDQEINQNMESDLNVLLLTWELQYSHNHYSLHRINNNHGYNCGEKKIIFSEPNLEVNELQEQKISSGF